MKKAIIGKKLGMTQIFTTDGLVVPVTVVEAGPCTVVQKKTEEKEGYNCVVVAFEEQKESRVNKAQLGTFKKANVPAQRINNKNVKKGTVPNFTFSKEKR